MTLFSGIEPAISLIEPGQQDVIERDRPEAISCLLQSDIFLQERVAGEALARLEAERSGIAHSAHQPVTWVSWGWQLCGHRSRRGAVERGRCLAVKCRMRALWIVFAAEAMEARLLGTLVALRWSRGFRCEGEVHALVCPVLLRPSRYEARMAAAECDPPPRELA